MPKARAYQQLSLREAAKFDFQTKQREKLTGWGIICKERAAAGVSRAARRRARKSE